MELTIRRFLGFTFAGTGISPFYGVSCTVEYVFAVKALPPESSAEDITLVILLFMRMMMGKYRAILTSIDVSCLAEHVFVEQLMMHSSSLLPEQCVIVEDVTPLTSHSLK